MFKLSIIFSVFLPILVVGIVEPGPKYPPTQGQVWPKLQQEKKKDIFYTLNPSNFDIKTVNFSCPILSDAIERYKSVISNLYSITERLTKVEAVSSEKGGNDDPRYRGDIRKLTINLTAPCERYPYLGMDESYNLTVRTTCNLKSSSIWGILRGIETFAQLFYLSDNYKELRINSTDIVDYPRHSHRGLLLDTSRHYISLPDILLTLDAMAMNKMNVFHWHIVDDQSFPYKSEKYPDLSERGAYHPYLVYTKQDIERIVTYAQNRGIRVIPEFDVPGHTRSWGVAYPNILTECYQDNKIIGLGPMNPINNVTYKIIRELFKEIQTLFPDEYFHVGGDEVELSCWYSNPDIRKYMKEHNISDVKDLHALFMRKTIPLISDKSKPIVWQEVFDENVPLSINTLVQVWKGDIPIQEMVNILSSGHSLLFSASWYLDHLKDAFGNFYSVDPRQWVYAATGNETLAKNVVGGEACMWGEMVDGTNFLSRVWPRASAVAERLWSPQQSGRVQTGRYRSPIPKEVYHRIEEHVCRMIRRGVPAEPATGPGFCIS